MSISSTSLIRLQSNPGVIRAQARSKPLTPRAMIKSRLASDGKRRWSRRRITTRAISWYRASSVGESFKGRQGGRPMPQLNPGVFLSLIFIALLMPTSTQMNKAKDSENLPQTQQAILQVEQEVFTAIKNQDTSALERI